MRNKIFFWIFIALGLSDILLFALGGNIFMLIIDFYMFIFSGFTVIIKKYEEMVDDCFRIMDSYQKLINKFLKAKKEILDE